MNKFNGYTNPDFALNPGSSSQLTARELSARESSRSLAAATLAFFFRRSARVRQNTLADSANQLIPNRLLKKKNGVFTRHNLLSLN